MARKTELKRCTECHLDLPKIQFYVSKVNGTFIASAICERCEFKTQDQEKIRAIKARLGSIKSTAKYCGHDWQLSVADFVSFWQQPCFYCGCEMKTCGLDRKDTTGIYVASNVVSSCHQCNQAKMNQTMEDFLSQIKRLLTNLDGIRNIKPDELKSNTTHCFICGKLHLDHVADCRAVASKIPLPSNLVDRKTEMSLRARINYQTPRGKYAGYRTLALAKGIEWKLSKEQFLSMWQKPCSYCLAPISTIGVDRIDSDVGYIPYTNLTVACGRCNSAKMDNTIVEFISWIERIGSNLKSSGLI